MKRYHIVLLIISIIVGCGGVIGSYGVDSETYKITPAKRDIYYSN